MPKRALSVFLLLLLAAAACGGDKHVYLIHVYVTGSATAVMGRTVKAGKREMPAFAANADIGLSFIELCTVSRDKFQNTPIPLTVSSGLQVVSMTAFTPVACSFMPGSIEEAHVFLEDDGTLLTDFTAGDGRVRASCLAGTPPPASCPRGEDF